MKAQLDEQSTEINQHINTATGRIEEVAKCLEENERYIVAKEKWDIGVKDTNPAT